ncbi:MAG TPA: hypothetical protein VGW12_05770 [Pyrinomonadaceae bacterium]|nr:hypothetical protein [Pyrinomonadaceae bacterium]
MKPQPPLAHATRDLPALHQLTGADVKARVRTKEEQKAADESAVKDEDFEKCLQAGFANCLLLGETKEGEEVKTFSVRAPGSDAAKLFSEKTVEAAIPANTSTTLGGRLKVGDVVDIIWFDSKDAASADPKCLDRLIVASVPAGKVPDAPAPTPATAETAATPKPSPTPETKPTAPPAAVISLKLRADQIKNLIPATTGGSKWMLVHKTHLSNYKNQNENETSLCPKSQTTP